MDKRLYISASALGHYRTCPYKFRLSRKWRVHGLSRPRYFEIGDEVHKIMADEMSPEDAKHSESCAHVVKLRALENSLQLNIERREVKQRVILDGMEIGGGRTLGLVTLTRILDGMGHDWQGNPIMIDYKTSGSVWEEMQSKGSWIAPLAVGPQAVLYTLQGPHQEEVQPNRIIFLVASAGAADAKFYVYTSTLEDTENVLLSVWQIQRDWLAGEFPRHKGYECTKCAWAAACHEADGWKEFYSRIRGS